MSAPASVPGLVADEPGRPGRYEVVVRGELGPAVRRALLPAHARPSEVQSVLRARLGDEHDLADLVAALRAHGLQLASITVVE
ncbi:hypothetical protein ACT8ZV_22210 [Nocardioides sp. MAHUQ-72]|uniref:hypothetical protein n=1 Tax=unclassified Nocardioides TaxID=2615069 RepID=UPI00361B1897